MGTDQPRCRAKENYLTPMFDLPLIIRADAGTRMGSGHLMRCIALGQAWRRQGGTVHFLTACDNEGLLNRLQKESFHVMPLKAHHPDKSDWETTAAILQQHRGAPVVADGYHFDLNYQNMIRSCRHPLLLVDDFAHSEQYKPDILLNQNINANELEYDIPSDTQLLLGTSYALLRSEFLAWQGKQRPFTSDSQNILVTLGGSDPDNQTEKVINGIAQLNEKGGSFSSLKVVVVIGATNPNRERLDKRIQEIDCSIELRQNVTDMPTLMNWADMAVCAGGSTCWEFAYFGVPMVINIIADNQMGIVEGLAKADTAVNLGWFESIGSEQICEALYNLILDPDSRKRMSQNARCLVDGKGADRVVAALMEFGKIKS